MSILSKKPPSLVLTFLAINFLLANIAASQEIISEKEISEYLVEVLVFRNLNQSKTTQEIEEADTQIIIEPSIAAYFEAPLSQMRQLNDTAITISNSSNYQLINYLAWIQSASDEFNTPYAKLTSMGLNESILLGSAKLYEQRFLHLSIKLGLAENSSRIESSRRIRLNQYYYLDNPDFGIITLVTRAKRPEPSELIVPDELIDGEDDATKPYVDNETKSNQVIIKPAELDDLLIE
ncbi:MAG: hypothetical protein VYA80_00145 [Pseudomonadota bacterium]|nr:hypothetical protein [Pseudomonadota bacterium]